MFSSKSFIVSGLTFRSLIHLEFIFVWTEEPVGLQSMDLQRVRVSTWCQEVFHFHSFTCSCPVLPAPFIEETVFAPLYILASFVKNKVPIGAWVYFRAFYLVPMVYISVFVPVPCSHQDCSFVVLPQVREVDSFSSILLSQDFFGYLQSFELPYEL